jgi:GDP-4-dehydro-6-deoxy-D-mannose reductase
VRGYWLATEHCAAGDVYNICSGKGYVIKDVLTMLLAMSTRKDIKPETDPLRLRPSDVPVLIGDYAKFREATGWHPTIAFERTVKDSLYYWRARQ